MRVLRREILKYGARGRTRTGTPSREGDFKSPASTIPPLGHRLC